MESKGIKRWVKWGGRKGKQMKRWIKIYCAHVPISHKEYELYILHTCTSKLKFSKKKPEDAPLWNLHFWLETDYLLHNKSVGEREPHTLCHHTLCH